MKAIDLRELADSVNLEYVEVTNNLSGYPENITGAITGFSNFIEAEIFANEQDLKLVKIVKKYGQELCTIAGDASRDYDITDFIDDSEYYTHDDLDYIKELLSEKIDDAKDFDELQEVVSDMNDLISAVAESDKFDEIVLSSIKEITNKNVMSFNHDSKTYMIGAVEKDTRVINVIK